MFDILHHLAEEASFFRDLCLRNKEPYFFHGLHKPISSGAFVVIPFVTFPYAATFACPDSPGTGQPADVEFVQRSLP